MKPLVYILSAVLLIFISVDFKSEVDSDQNGNTFISAIGFGCSKPVPENKGVAGWPEEQYYVGFNDFIDHLRGNLYTLGSLSPRQMGRKDDKKNPGDYLDGPSYVKPRPGKHRPDSISVSKLERYIGDLLKPEYAKDEMISYVSDYDDIWGDTTRDEFFGRFIIKGEKMSLGGWYDKFAVFGLYLPYNDAQSFLSEARKYIILPNIDVDSVKVTQQDTTYYFEYICRESGFRLRGFPVSFIAKKNQKNNIQTKVIEFTKYYDKEFVP